MITPYGLKELTTELTKATNEIPLYWMKAIENSKFFATNEKDKKILEFLNEIRVEFLEDKKSFKATFLFRQNEYFNHTELTKTYFWNSEEEAYNKTEATQIVWEKENPTKKTVTKKVKSKSLLIYIF